MPSLRWAPAALNDLARLHLFLHSKSPEAAKRAIATIRQGVRLLADHPEAGARLAGSELRSWPVRFGAGGYRVLYRATDAEIVLLAVRHGREAGFAGGSQDSQPSPSDTDEDTA